MYSELIQTSKMELFSNIKPLTILGKSSMLDIWLGSECAFGTQVETGHNWISYTAYLGLHQTSMVEPFPRNIESPVDNYMYKVNNGNTKARCKIRAKLKITPEWCQWLCAGVVIVNFEHIP